MSEQDPRDRNPRERPPDPAGTRPRHDPDSLLPETSEPLLADDLVEAEVVAERDEERGDLLPARRRPGGAPEPVAPAAHSQYAPRFHFLTGALVAVGVAALAGIVLFIALPGGGTDNGQRWSSWTPTTGGTAGAQQIADHVGTQYKLPDGRQIVNVGVTGLEIQGVPLAVAVRQDPAQGGSIKVFDDGGVIYHLCGLGPSCAINSGKPSTQRGLLLRREALELALYSFRYLGGIHQVVVFMPPQKGKTPTQALFFREGDVAKELDRPLTASLSPRVPSVGTITVSPDTPLVVQITSPKTFDFSLTGDQTSQRGYIVLDPPTDPAASTSGSSSSSSSSGSSGSSSSASSGSSGSSSGTTSSAAPASGSGG
ncbi:MAG: hypothetical protein QOH72_1154 [Solirubrobacteraceae bacterium]|jgi:uncharacterized membrane protein YgcG|nr:hypothetical protein [Solirubrobacteraceae bacterium]